MSYVLSIITIPFDSSSKAIVNKTEDDNKPPVVRPTPKVVVTYVDKDLMNKETNGSDGENEQDKADVSENVSTASQQEEIVLQDTNEFNTKQMIEISEKDEELQEEEKERAKRLKRLQKGFSYYDMTKVCQKILKKHKVIRPAWVKTEGDTHWKILFHIRSNEIDSFLNSLLLAGIGNNNYTSVSVIPVNIHFPSMVEDSDNEDESEVSDGGKEREKSEFLQTVKSRMNVAQVISSVRSGSMLTFDYVMLLILAGMIAAVGLMENSSVLLVASMLVSPLMGPILGGTFGLVLQHKRVWKPAIQNELIGLSICLGVGFIFGLFTFCGGLSNWDVVTSEMKSRGQARGLIVGVLIAIPSGAAVALSILGGNVGSLVGVAISASLLPPAVNAGMFWSFAIICLFSGTPKPDPEKILDFYPSDLAKLGLISVTLTLVNIVIIFVMGVLILKIKEVAPHTASAITTNFWKKDIRKTRQLLNSQLSEEETLLKDWGRINNVDLTNKQTIQEPEGRKLLSEFRDYCEFIIEKDADYSAVTNRLPLKTTNRFTQMKVLQDLNPSNSRFTVKSVLEAKETTFISRFAKTKLDVIDSAKTTSSQKYGTPIPDGASSTNTIKNPSKNTVTINIKGDDTPPAAEDKEPLL